MGETFTAYWGEFLISPIPLELSFNYCSHLCSYCFANLNKPQRKADLKATMNMLANFRDRKSVCAEYLQQGYPVLVSNHVDPFAASNWRTALPVLEVMTEIGIPIAFQTRGGRGIEEALQFLAPSVWDLSITHNSEETREIVEPGAPSLKSRFELIEKLRNAGHRVVFSICPLAEEWVPNPKALIEQAMKCGAEGVWIEPLHFNAEQDKAMPKSWREAIGPDLVLKARKRRKLHPDHFDHWIRTRNAAAELGLPYFSAMQSTRSEFWKPYLETYSMLFPTLQDWINKLIDEGYERDRWISFREFADFFLPLLPEGRHDIGSYVAVNAHQIPREQSATWTNFMDFERLLKYAWQDPRIPFCPAIAPALAHVLDEAGKVILDSEGLPYMAFWSEYLELLNEDA